MYEQLKKAAEACKDLLPLRYMDSHGSLYVRNDCGIVFDVHQNRSFPDFMAHNKAYADLALAANPSVVLALIAAHEMEKGSVDEWQDLAARRAARMTELMNEVDRLEAEIEALRKDAERYRWLRQHEFDIGSYHPVHEHNAAAWFEYLSTEDIDRCIADEADFAKECGQ